MQQQVSFSFKIPAFLSIIMSFAFIRQVAVEIAQTAGVAAAVAGLTALAQLEPTISAHYGLSPIMSAQLVAVIGAARAFVSGLNSAKQPDLQAVTALSADAIDTAMSAQRNATAAVQLATKPPVVVQPIPPAAVS